MSSWDVYAFDISEEGKNKAEQLAKKNNATIQYEVGVLENLSFQENQFDIIALIFAHFPAEIKSQMHFSLNKLLKKDGIIIFEAFSKNNLELVNQNPKIGGPKDINMLFSTDEIKSDFPNFEILELEEKLVELNEGIYHNGIGSVIRFVGKKLF